MTIKLPSEQVAIVAVIDPDANSATTYTSDYVNMEYFHQAMAIVSAGIIATSGTIDALLVQATSSSGAGAKAITASSITQLTTGDNDEQSVINVRADQLDLANGFKWLAVRMTVATAAADSAAVLLGLNPRFGPANANDLASVGEIVTV